MKIFNFFIIIINIFLIKEIISKRNLEEINCESFNDCFNCSVCGNNLIEKCPCSWKTDLCYEVTYNPIITNWIYYYENCEDYSSINTQKEYCGEITTKNKKSIISFPEKNGHFGLNKLFCSYIFINEQKPKTKFNIDIHINEKYMNNNNNIFIEFIVNYNNNTYQVKNIFNNNEELSYQKISSFQFFIMSRDLYNDNPFFIEITYSNGLFIDQIYLILGIIILFLIICIIIVYCCSKKKRNRHIISRENNVRTNENDDEEVQIENNKKIIEILLSNPSFLGERICEKEYEKYGTNCTICLEELKVNIDKVSLTPCGHVFHFKCVKDWLNKNLSDLNLKCPNCNFDLSTMIQNKSERSSINRIGTNNPINYFSDNENQIVNNNNRPQFNNFARISNSNNSNNTRYLNNRYENNNIINNNDDVSNNIPNRNIRQRRNNRNIQQSVKSSDNLESINI